MFSFKSRDVRRGRPPKGLKNLARLYKEGKCRECSVVVTRMDFAKILGKFTKVKIQYENTPKDKSSVNEKSPNSNARLKNNENGMVLIHRSAYKEHPVKDLLNSKKHDVSNPVKNTSPQVKFNILKENNRLPKTASHKEQNSSYNRKRQSASNFTKQYGIIFIQPESDLHNVTNKVCLSELLPGINEDILPSEEWSIDYFPKDEEPKEDHVYDRIAAELEDLMYNDKDTSKTVQQDVPQQKTTDDFPSIMDILNDNSNEVNNSETTNLHSVSSENTEFKSSLESTDVEAMLLGDSDVNKQITASMDVDKLIEGVPLNSEKTLCNSTNEEDKLLDTDLSVPSIDERCNSPSILDETLSKGLEENLPNKIEENVPNRIEENLNCESSVDHEVNKKNDTNEINNEILSTTNDNEIKQNEDSNELDEQSKIIFETPIHDENETIKDTNCVLEEPKKIEVQVPIVNGPSFMKNEASVTHIVFKQMKNGSCCRSVTCPKNLKYSIELEGKPVQLVGAPELISSLDDLQVLLQIVNESGLSSFYVVH
ncbi:hypothetical protein EVAR_26496_1 [Eumeta japonica]|uniref:Uncharacterized protein n=1 Tax=Eumeta variegata TaxID=151549 RepID=A0A4C1V8Q5_EUMVA|nr:hypothetical protein EVAR_26496_1 [Eumeta japonica]